MKRFMLYVWMMLLAAGLVGAAERVRATYEMWPGKRVVREWRIERAPGRVRFYLDGQLRAVAWLEKGRVRKLVLRKRHAGEWKDMVITSPVALQLELQSGFYPFRLIQPDGEKTAVWKSGATRFELIEAAVPE